MSLSLCPALPLKQFCKSSRVSNSYQKASNCKKGKLTEFQNFSNWLGVTRYALFNTAGLVEVTIHLTTIQVEMELSHTQQYQLNKDVNPIKRCSSRPGTVRRSGRFEHGNCSGESATICPATLSLRIE